MVCFNLGFWYYEPGFVTAGLVIAVCVLLVAPIVGRVADWIILSPLGAAVSLILVVILVPTRYLMLYSRYHEVNDWLFAGYLLVVLVAGLGNLLLGLEWTDRR